MISAKYAQDIREKLVYQTTTSEVLEKLLPPNVPTFFPEPAQFPILNEKEIRFSKEHSDSCQTILLLEIEILDEFKINYADKDENNAKFLSRVIEFLFHYYSPIHKLKKAKFSIINHPEDGETLPKLELIYPKYHFDIIQKIKDFHSEFKEFLMEKAEDISDLKNNLLKLRKIWIIFSEVE